MKFLKNVFLTEGRGNREGVSRGNVWGAAESEVGWVRDVIQKARF